MLVEYIFEYKEPSILNIKVRWSDYLGHVPNSVHELAYL